MRIRGLGFALVAVFVAITVASGADHVLVSPTPPRKAKTSEEVARVKAVLAEGTRQKRQAERNSGRKFRGLYHPSVRFEVGSIGILGGQGGQSMAKRNVVQVVDKENMLLENGDDAFCLRGFPTQNIVDNDRVQVNSYVEVTGTRKYGALTILVIEPFPLQVGTTASPR
ncbi:MAG: hypothetical protein HUU20_16070 [Pirellulales bacterium]|nr:hypothetical protein [Pirellulales bacterium]